MMAISQILFCIKLCIVRFAILLAKITMFIVPPKKKGMIFYNQQHGTTSMKKHILGEHPVTWHGWKNVNVAFDSKELHKKKSKKTFFIGYGAIITNH
jgi:hypothetical protein